MNENKKTLIILIITITLTGCINTNNRESAIQTSTSFTSTSKMITSTTSWTIPNFPLKKTNQSQKTTTTLIKKNNIKEIEFCNETNCTQNCEENPTSCLKFCEKFPNQEICKNQKIKQEYGIPGKCHTPKTCKVYCAKNNQICRAYCMIDSSNPLCMTHEEMKKSNYSKQL